jgi:amino acid adenylation domain-containing protein
MPYLLHQAIISACDQFPEREAVRFSGKSLSYGELYLRASSLSRLLIEQGLKRGERVGIFMNKSLESAVSIYGIMMAGGAYVPLDPFAPTARIQYVIQDCGIQKLITNELKHEQLVHLTSGQTGLDCLIGLSAADDLPLECVSWDEAFAHPGHTSEKPGAIEQDLAYILYTSGSTGNPKGIMHTHRSGLSFAQWAVDTYSLHSKDRLSNHAPLHFDLSTFDFFSASLAGAATVIIPEAVTKFPASLSKLMANEKISVWYSVPFALIQLLNHGKLESRDLTALRWVLFAGEPFPTKHLRELMVAVPRARFSNLYGPTETNVCTYYHVPDLAHESDEPIPIGSVCANVEGLVLDADGKEAAPGEVGELLIRGPVVMRGYWGQPEMTQRSFFHREVFTHYEDIFYRTGDLVQSQPDGDYKYLGRKDRQIKTRGYRVELDDVEVALLSHAMVEEAAVFPVPDNQGSNLIEAAVTTKNGGSLTAADLIEHIALRLPSYAIPVKIFITADFPRTSTGKINRRELQAQALADLSRT